MHLSNEERRREEREPWCGEKKSTCMRRLSIQPPPVLFLQSPSFLPYSTELTFLNGGRGGVGFTGPLCSRGCAGRGGKGGCREQSVVQGGGRAEDVLPQPVARRLRGDTSGPYTPLSVCMCVCTHAGSKADLPSNMHINCTGTRHEFAPPHIGLLCGCPLVFWHIGTTWVGSYSLLGSTGSTAGKLCPESEDPSQCPRAGACVCVFVWVGGWQVSGYQAGKWAGR